ncbi:MAG: CysZ protein [Psychromonas sp.]|jgi:CysZ protein
MRFVKHFWLGILSYKKAIAFIWEHKLYMYIAIPAILMLGIYQLGYWIKSHHFRPELHTFNDIVWYTLWLLIEISIAVLLMKFSKYLVVVLLSPLLSFLSTKTDKIITGNVYQFSISQLVNDVKRSSKIVVRNFMWEYFFFLILFVVSFLGWDDAESSPVFYLTFVIGFYYYGFSFMDYTNERLRIDIDESILFVRKHKGLATALGAGYSLLILLPVDLSILFSVFNMNSPVFSWSAFLLQLLLWMLASIAPILTIVASTIAVHEVIGLSKEEIDSNSN